MCANACFCQLHIKWSLILLLQLEMYQPQQQHQSATVMLHQHQQPGTGVLYTVTGQPVTFTSASQVCESYNSRQSVIVGIILIITGIMSIVWNAFAISYGEVISVLGFGIWCGVLVSKICCRLCLYYYSCRTPWVSFSNHICYKFEVH